MIHDVEWTRLDVESDQVHLARLKECLESEEMKLPYAVTEWDRANAERALDMTKRLITGCKKRIEAYEIRWRGTELLRMRT